MPRIRERGVLSVGPQTPQVASVSPQDAWQLPTLPSLPSFPLGTPLASMGQQGLPEAIVRWAASLFSGPTDGERLQTALTSCASDWRAAAIGAFLSSGGLIAATANLLSPTGPGGCDHNQFERCANCATSVPYVMVGVHAMKNRKTAAGKAWGASMCAVGMASTTFHASTGKWRTFGRRADYWSIALASNLLTRAVYPDIPITVTAAGMLLTPFRPFLVSFLNSSAMEYRFLQCAQKRPGIRHAQQLHAATCIAGLSAFALEEFFPRLPLVHAAWHCLSATAVAHVNTLLDDVERHHPTRAQRKQMAAHPILLTADSTPLLVN